MAFSHNLEALAEAIIAYSGYHDPTSDLYRARNPGGLRALAKHRRDEHGNRVFSSVLHGFEALLADLRVRITGEFPKGAFPDPLRIPPAPVHTLTELASAYGGTRVTAAAWSKFLRKALQDDLINPETEPKRFL